MTSGSGRVTLILDLGVEFFPATRAASWGFNPAEVTLPSVWNDVIGWKEEA
jgi:hypothetical protein